MVPRRMALKRSVRLNRDARTVMLGHLVVDQLFFAEYSWIHCAVVLMPPKV